MTVSAGGDDSRDGGHSGQRERPIGRERLSPQLCMLVIWRLSSVANTLHTGTTTATWARRPRGEHDDRDASTTTATRALRPRGEHDDREASTTTATRALRPRREHDDRDASTTTARRARRPRGGRCAAAIAARRAAIAAEPTNTDPTYLPASPSIVHRKLKAMVIDFA